MLNLLFSFWMFLSGSEDPTVKQYVGSSGKEVIGYSAKGYSAKGYSVKMPIEPPECLQPLDRLTLEPFPPIVPRPINPPPVTDANPRKNGF